MADSLTDLQRERVDLFLRLLSAESVQHCAVHYSPAFADAVQWVLTERTALLSRLAVLEGSVEQVRFRCSEPFAYPRHWGPRTPYQEGRHDGINMERRDVAALLPEATEKGEGWG